MIISRTPFCISIFSGGTDYPIWHRENGDANNIEINPISIKPKKLERLLVKPELQAEVRKALGNLLVIPLKFETSGSQIFFSKPGTYYGN